MSLDNFFNQSQVRSAMSILRQALIAIENKRFRMLTTHQRWQARAHQPTKHGTFAPSTTPREPALTSTEFARLSDTNPRDAWPEEARDFTLWLVDNIDHLSEALDLDLEATD